MSSSLIVPTIATRWAAAALLTYDIFLTLEQEIALVWKSSWTVPKVLYFFIRYWGVAWSILNCAISLERRSPHFCSILNIGTTSWLLIAAAAGDALLMLRVLALLKDKRKWCLTLKCIYGVMYSVIFVALCFDLSRSPILPSDQTGGPNLGCTDITTAQTMPSLAETLLSIATGPILLFNVLLLSIIVFKIFPQYRSQADLTTPLLTLIVRDGAIYFVIMVFSLGFVTVTPVALWNQPTMSMMSLSLFLSISPVAACRLFLNLRAKAIGPPQETAVRFPTPVHFNTHADEESLGKYNGGESTDTRYSTDVVSFAAQDEGSQEDLLETKHGLTSWNGIAGDSAV